MIVFAALLNLALLTSNKYFDFVKSDDKLLIEALREYDIEARSVDWRSSEVNWPAFDAALIYSTWDYYEDYAKFLANLQKIELLGLKVCNPPNIVKWNSSKKYLKDLEDLGLKTIESLYISSKELDTLQPMLIENGWVDCVIKPQVSTSGHNTFRFKQSNIEHVKNKFKGLNEDLIVQPFAEEIEKEGEWSFVFVNKEYIHCVLKKPPQGGFLVQKGTKVPVQPPEWMIQAAQNIVDTIDLPVLQTRVDVIRRGKELIIMEIEMIEPVLYLRYFPGSAKKVARMISEEFLKPTASPTKLKGRVIPAFLLNRAY